MRSLQYQHMRLCLAHHTWNVASYLADHSVCNPTQKRQGRLRATAEYTSQSVRRNDADVLRAPARALALRGTWHHMRRHHLLTQSASSMQTMRHPVACHCFGPCRGRPSHIATIWHGATHRNVPTTSWANAHLAFNYEPGELTPKKASTTHARVANEHAEMPPWIGHRFVALLLSSPPPSGEQHERPQASALTSVLPGKGSTPRNTG